LDGNFAGIRHALNAGTNEGADMKLLSKTGTHLSEAGARIIEFFRAGYPEIFPRRGFNPAVALLAHRFPDGQEPTASR
jgi:hypothetical protein